MTTPGSGNVTTPGGSDGAATAGNGNVTEPGGRGMTNPVVPLAVGAVRVYQWTLRPIIGNDCRFYPRCSDYAIDAFRTHGAVRGGMLAAKRILRCNPWCEGGYDPVPACDCKTGL